MVLHSFAGQRTRVALAAIPFLTSMALLGFSVSTGALRGFAIGWPLLQVLGYTFTLRIAEGDFRHPLVAAQTMLHFLALALVAAVFARAL